MFKYCFQIILDFISEFREFDELEEKIGLEIYHTVPHTLGPQRKNKPITRVSFRSKEYHSSIQVYVGHELEKYLRIVAPKFINNLDYLKAHDCKITTQILVDDELIDDRFSLDVNEKFMGVNITNKAIKLLAKMHTCLEIESYLSHFTPVEEKHISRKD